jgi:uncharacterized protein YjbI with pentapeptide repeats
LLNLQFQSIQVALVNSGLNCVLPRISYADLSYADLTGASLREANLVGTLLYPAETTKAEFYGAKFARGSDAADYARIALEEMWRRMRIKPGSVAYAKLQRINGSRSVPYETAPAYN